MDAFLFSFNAVFPIFLVMALGYFLNHIGIINDNFIKIGTKITFTVAIPCMVFPNIIDASIDDTFDPKLIIFVVGVTLLTVLILRLITPGIIKDPREWTAFIQGAFRSNYLIIGFALIDSMGGAPALAKASMLLCFVGPLYNILSVLVLAEATKGTAEHHILKSLITNPVIISTTLGLILAAVGFKLPDLLRSPINMMGDMALPLSLLTLGASISFKHGDANIPRSITASLIKVLFIPLVFLPIAYLLGFRGIDMILCLVAFASPSAVSCFPMAYQMGADAKLSGMIIAFTNTFAMGSLFLIVYILRLLSII